MSAAFTRRRVVIFGVILLLVGVALYYTLRTPPPALPAPAPAPAPGTVAGKKPAPAPRVAEAPPFVPPLSLADAAGMSTADIAMKLAAWPEGKIHPDLPKWAALLAARGTVGIVDLSSALATAETNTGRGVLSDALARIGTDDAIQELCTQAVKAPDGPPRQAIATAFRALSRPTAVPMLATLLSEVDSTPLITEASDAIRRLADRAGVEALADLSQEGIQDSAQRDSIFRILSTLENPEALTALQTLAADGTDTARAAAARAGVSRLKHKVKQ